MEIRGFEYMTKGLDKQVYIYSLGTESFYNEEEWKIHNKILKASILKKKIANKLEKCKNENRINAYKSRNKFVNGKLNDYKSELKLKLSGFEGVRELRGETLKQNKVIGIFDSALSRTIGMKINELSTSLIIVRAYYFNVLEDIINNGFEHEGEKYIYFSSSAGQIRTKKVVFIKESLWNKYENTLTCGLTIDEINKKRGINVNKLLAYKALISSASMEWKNFDIDKTIVVPDLSSPVTSVFDYIDRDTYEITRKELTIDIEHTDGCGMILPIKSKKSFMSRLPYVKGLITPFDFRRFAIESGNTKIKDIYGKEWDIVDDDIQVIFTKSQFKMAKYYKDWEDYKDKFKKYNCKANKLNEEDISSGATLTYQMLQTLTDMTNKELKQLSSKTISDLEKIHTDKSTILRMLGADHHNSKKNYFQQALELYPEMINDAHSKRIIKDKKRAMLKDAYSGKLGSKGKYLYIIPDLYAFCEFLFKGEKHPKGLLENGQVNTKVFKEGKVDVLRSPHLYKEHAIRNNVENEKLTEWFTTNGIYISIHDAISRILQCDFDGDTVLVNNDDTLIEVAERNMQGIYPLYYEMGVAEAEIITNDKIYDSLTKAFKANIGEVSNNITKIFNSNEEVDLEVVKWLTAENNYIIDFAKTLYMPKRPYEVDKRIKNAIKGKVPHFFIEAKNKDKENVEALNNSTVNRIRKIIPNKRLKFEDVAGEFDYKNLLGNDIEYVNHKIVSAYRKLDRSKKWIMRDSGITDRTEGMLYVYKYIREELSKVESDEHKIVNVLVKELFDNVDSPNKETLWHCYGDIILYNMKNNLKGSKQCEECGKRVEIYNAKKYCDECADIVWKEQVRINMIKYRKNKKAL